MHEYNVMLMNEVDRQEAARRRQMAEWRREARAAQPATGLFASLSALLRRRFSRPERPAAYPLQPRRATSTQEIPC